MQDVFQKRMGDPAFKLQNKHLAAQTPLPVAVQDVRQRIRRDDGVDRRIVQIVLHFGGRIEMRHHEHDATRAGLLQATAAFRDGRARPHHVVEHDYFAPFDVLQFHRAVLMADHVHAAFADALLVHPEHADLTARARQQRHLLLVDIFIQIFVDLFHERTRSVVGGADHDAAVAVRIQKRLFVGQKTCIQLRGGEVEEVVFAKYLGEHLRNR